MERFLSKISRISTAFEETFTAQKTVKKKKRIEDLKSPWQHSTTIGTWLKPTFPSRESRKEDPSTTTSGFEDGLTEGETSFNSEIEFRDPFSTSTLPSHSSTQQSNSPTESYAGNMGRYVSGKGLNLPQKRKTNNKASLKSVGVRKGQSFVTQRNTDLSVRETKMMDATSTEITLSITPEDCVAHFAVIHSGRRGKDGSSMLYCKETGVLEQTNHIGIRHGKEILVGRGGRCGYVLPQNFVSSIHFRLYSVCFENEKDSLVYCEDLSVNGTYLNGRRIGRNKAALVSHGDRLEIRHSISLIFHQAASQFLVPNDTSSTKEAQECSEKYQISHRLLGSGGFGKVYMAYSKKTGVQVACKIVELEKYQKASSANKNRYEAEVTIMQMLNHPNIIRVHEIIPSPSYIFIFQDLITGGDLFSHIQARGSLPETEAMCIMWQLLHAVEYLHKSGIVHRDLKPDNILLTSNRPGARIVITDFGVAKCFSSPKERMFSIVGTPEYYAPEIALVAHPDASKPAAGKDAAAKKKFQVPFMNNHADAAATLRRAQMKKAGHGPPVDLWSVGVILYLILSNTTAFGDPDVNQVVRNIEKCSLDRMNMGIDEWSKVSHEARDLIRGLLQPDPEKRFTTKQALEHVWLGRHSKELTELHKKAIVEHDDSYYNLL